MKKYEIYYGWWIVIGGTVIMAFATPMINALSTLFIIPISDDLGISRSSFIITSTITSIASIMSSFVIGRYINFKNIKKIQVCSTLVLALSYGSYAFAQKIGHIYIASLFMGFSYMLAGMLPISIMVSNWFEQKRGLAMSIVLSGVGIGAAIFSPLITVIMTNYSWRMSRIFVALTLVLVTIPIILFVMKTTPEEIGLKPYGYFFEGLIDNKLKGNVNFEIDNNIILKEFIKNRYFYLFMLGVVTSGIVCGGAMQQIGPFFTDLYSPTYAGMIISIYSFSAIFGKLILGWLYDRFDNIISLVFGCFAFGVSFILMAFCGQSMISMIIAAIFFGAGNSIGSININLITFSIFGRKYYSKMLSISKSVQQIGMAIGPPLLSSMYDRTNSYKVVWIISIFVTFIVLIAWCVSCKNSTKLHLDQHKTVL